jgi:hypothetical protein
VSYWEILWKLPADLVVEVLKGIATEPPEDGPHRSCAKYESPGAIPDTDQPAVNNTIQKQKRKDSQTGLQTKKQRLEIEVLEHPESEPIQSSDDIEIEWQNETGTKNFNAQMRSLTAKRVSKLTKKYSM